MPRGDYLRQKSPLPPDWYYHAIATDEQQGMNDWWDAVQEAQLRGFRERLAALLQAAYDGTLELTKSSCATRAYLQGRYYYYDAKMVAALASYEQALELFRQVGSKLGEANCYLAQGRVALRQGEYEKALKLHTEAYLLYQHIQDRYSQARLFITAPLSTKQKASNNSLSRM